MGSPGYNDFSSVSLDSGSHVEHIHVTTSKLESPKAPFHFPEYSFRSKSISSSIISGSWQQIFAGQAGEARIDGIRQSAAVAAPKQTRDLGIRKLRVVVCFRVLFLATIYCARKCPHFPTCFSLFPPQLPLSHSY